jgi:hypothetical protein
MTIEQTYKAVKPTDCMFWLMGRYHECHCKQCDAAIQYADELRSRGEVPPVMAG